MDKDEINFIAKALELLNAKGNERITTALLQDLEEQHRDLKRKEAA